MLTTTRNRDRFSVKAIMLLVIAFNFAGYVYAADDGTATALLNELQSVTAQLRETEAQGQQVKDTRASDRREMDRLQPRESSLAGDREKLDNRVVGYNAESETFNSECTGATVSQAQSRNCDARQRQLASLAASIDRDADLLGSKVDDYNAEVDEYNAQDAELAREEEALYAQSQEYVRRIEEIKNEFEAFAVSYGDDDFVTDTGRCNAMQGYEDTHFCLSAVWRIVSQE